MNATGTNGLEAFEQLCQSTREKWDAHPGLSHHFQSPAKLLPMVWTADNAVQAAKQKVKATKFSAAINGIGSTGIAIGVAVALANPVALAFGVPIAVISAVRWHRSRIPASDIKTLEKTIPEMQEELTEVLDAAKATAKELSQRNDKAGVEKIEETLREFLKDELDITDSTLKKGTGPKSLNGDGIDFTAIKISSRAVKEVRSIASNTRRGGGAGGSDSFDLSNTRDLGPNNTTIDRPQPRGLGD